MSVPINVPTRVFTSNPTLKASAKTNGAAGVSAQRVDRRREDQKRDKGKLHLAPQRKVELDIFDKDWNEVIRYEFYFSVCKLIGDGPFT